MNDSETKAHPENFDLSFKFYNKDIKKFLENRDTIKFLKIRNVKSPKRAYILDAGIDFFVPEFNVEFIKDLKDKNENLFGPDTSWGIQPSSLTYASGNLTIAGKSTKVEYDLSDKNDSIIKFDDIKGENYFLLPPHSRVMIPSGIKSRMPNPGTALIAANKSGIATKHGLVFGAQVVDYTYQGEIHLSVINTSTKNVRIYENMKLLQFVETPVFNSNIEIVDYDVGFITKFYDGMLFDRGSDGFGSTDEEEDEELDIDVEDDEVEVDDELDIEDDKEDDLDLESIVREWEAEDDDESKGEPDPLEQKEKQTKTKK